MISLLGPGRLRKVFDDKPAQARLLRKVVDDKISSQAGLRKVFDDKSAWA